MITFLSENLLHLWLAFMLILSGGVLEAVRRLLAREQLLRGGRP